MEYHDMSPQERFAELDSMATQLFETDRWKTALTKKYGITTQAANKWKREGAPLWVVVATKDALDAKRLDVILHAVYEAD